MLLLFLGIMAGQLMYMCTLWLQHRKPEYRYYVIHYIIFVYFLFGLSYIHLFPQSFIEANKDWFDLLLFHPLHIFNYYLYIRFAQHYLETRKLFPRKNQQAVYMMRAVWICTGVSTICWLLMDINSQLYQSIYLGISLFLMVWAIYLVYLIYTMRTRQSAYLFRGSLLLSVGVMLTYVLISMQGEGLVASGPAIFYPSVVGVLGEIYFVNAGLNYKASIKRKQLIRSQQQWIEELERNKSLLQEREAVRNDLSLQLNKDIGVTLNGISLFAQHSLTQIQSKQWGQIGEVLDRIVKDANKMVTTMNEIVWLLSAENDTLSRSLLRIRSFTTRSCREMGLICQIDDAEGKDVLVKLNMATRRMLYQGYKVYFQQFADNCRDSFELKLTARGHLLTMLLRGNCKHETKKNEMPVFVELKGFHIVGCEMFDTGIWELNLTFDTAVSAFDKEMPIQIRVTTETV